MDGTYSMLVFQSVFPFTKQHNEILKIVLHFTYIEMPYFLFSMLKSQHFQP